MNDAGPFWEAEAEDQDYLQRHPDGSTCHFLRPNWKLPTASPWRSGHGVVAAGRRTIPRSTLVAAGAMPPYREGGTLLGTGARPGRRTGRSPHGPP